MLKSFSHSQRLLIIVALSILVLVVMVPVAIGRTSIRPAGEPMASVTAGRLNVRSGPDATYSVVETIDRHDNLPLVGRTRDASWVQVRMPGDYLGWVETQYVYTEADLQKLAVTLDPAALPTQPHITLSDGVVSPGKSITVLAEGFNPQQRVEAYLYSSEAGAKQKIGTGVANSEGTAELDLVMPSTWGNGQTISQSNVTLVVGSPEGVVNETANLEYVFGREATLAPSVVDATFKALREGDRQIAVGYLTGAAQQRLEASGENPLYNLTGVSKDPAKITGYGTRVVEVRGDRVKAESVLIFGDTFVRLASELTRVEGNYLIQDLYVTGIYDVQDTAVVG